MESRESIYCKVGEAMYFSQILELQIIALSTILNERFSAGIDRKKLFLESDKQTLGKLIITLKKHGSLDDTGSKILQDALEKRNYIAHHFFKRNVYAFSEDNANESAVERLEVAIKTLAEATAMTLGFLEGFCSAFKIELSDVLVEQDL
jgi:hypothetical protein